MPLRVPLKSCLRGCAHDSWLDSVTNCAFALSTSAPTYLPAFERRERLGEHRETLPGRRLRRAHRVLRAGSGCRPKAVASGRPSWRPTPPHRLALFRLWSWLQRAGLLVQRPGCRKPQARSRVLAPRYSRLRPPRFEKALVVEPSVASHGFGDREQPVAHTTERTAAGASKAFACCFCASRWAQPDQQTIFSHPSQLEEETASTSSARNTLGLALHVGAKPRARSPHAQASCLIKSKVAPGGAVIEKRPSTQSTISPNARAPQS